MNENKCCTTRTPLDENTYRCECKDGSVRYYRKGTDGKASQIKQEDYDNFESVRADIRARNQPTCTTCNCNFIMETVKAENESASPTFQITLKDQEGRKYFMKAWPVVLQMEEFGGLNYEKGVYQYIQKHFSSEDCDTNFKKNFVSLADEPCQYTSIKDLINSVNKSVCNDCKDNISKRFKNIIGEYSIQNTNPVQIQSLVTTICPGTISLYEFLKNKKLEFTVKERVLKRICEVMQYMHETMGLYHLDFHSENILVCMKNEQWEPLFFDWDRAQLSSTKRNPFNNVHTFYLKESVKEQTNKKWVDVYNFLDRIFLMNIIIPYVQDHFKLYLTLACIGNVTYEQHIFIIDTLIEPEDWHEELKDRVSDYIQHHKAELPGLDPNSLPPLVDKDAMTKLENSDLIEMKLEDIIEAFHS